MRFASPAVAFASCTTSGRPEATAMSAPGNDAKPPKDDPQAVDARREQGERTEQQRLEPLAADAPKRHRLEFDAMLRNEFRLDAFARPHPEDAHASPDELRRDGEAGKHVSARPAGGDHDGGGHRVNPLGKRPDERAPGARTATGRRQSRCRLFERSPGALAPLKFTSLTLAIAGTEGSWILFIQRSP